MTLAGQDRGLDLFAAGLVDSFLVVLLVGYIEERYGVLIPDEDMQAETLGTIDRLAGLVVDRATNGIAE